MATYDGTYEWSYGTSATTTADATWCYWNISTTGTVANNWATTTASDTTWFYWNRWVYEPQQPTEEERTEIQRQFQQAQERERLAAEVRAKELAEATERAVALLEQNLNDQQRQQYAKTRSFTVVSGKSGRTYRIDHGYSQNVRLLNGDGSVEKTLCAHPKADVPIEDHMLAQKLFLEYAEEDFLRVANVIHGR